LQSVLEEWNKAPVLPRPHPDEPTSVTDRGARHLLGSTEALREAGRGEERLSRPGRVARTCLCVADPEEQFAAQVFIPSLDELERLEGDAVQTSRLLEGKARSRDVARPASVIDGAGRIGLGDREEEVMRQLGEMGLALDPIQALEDVACSMVDRNAPTGWDRVVERVPDERMREPKTTRRSGDLAQGASPDGFLDEIQQLARWPLFEPGDGLELELMTDHRGQPK
jgi:hypothetical protein